ncbi:hypothetical protein D6D01_08444 [Aureobasidium pullulans]|uniref:Uncharacterized protein n=1 Tax=Aureobasidium pullulans TaxID=5580 RepID=A0A4S9KCN4_AURPU|nr:hypothetical protein D6D01_08444 [Aureobasidium pullulans]
MSDHLAYEYDHSKATVPELIDKLEYLNDKQALDPCDEPLTQTQRKWELIARLEEHYALQREYLRINVKDYLHLCHEKTYRNKVTCPELRNILSQYDIVYPDDPSRAQLLEVLDKNILWIRKPNHCQELDTELEKFKKARKAAAMARKEVETGQKSTRATRALYEGVEDNFNYYELRNHHSKEVKETWTAWGSKLAKFRLSYAPMALVPGMILAAQAVTSNGATPSPYGQQAYPAMSQKAVTERINDLQSCTSRPQIIAAPARANSPPSSSYKNDLDIEANLSTPEPAGTRTRQRAVDRIVGGLA